jgi:Flp pilus assembly protein TadD
MPELKVQKMRFRKYSLAASVAVATFALYLPDLRNGIVYWDDYTYVVANPHIHALDAAFFRWAFFDFYACNWHPLTWISHAVDYAIWGLNPLGPHLTNNIIHAINAGVVVLLVIKLLDILKERPIQNAPSPFLNERTVLITGGATGLLFGIHPVHVESVAWIAERKDLLCALFFLLSVMMYAKYISSQGSEVRSQRSEGSRKDGSVQKNLLFNKHYIASLGFFSLALLSKPMAVTLPPVLLILDWYPFGRVRSFKTLWAASIEKLPFIALSLASSVLTILAQRTQGAIQSTVFAPPLMRVIVAANALIAYLWKIIWPLDLVPYYPYPENASFLSIKYLLSIALIIGITITCLAVIKRQKIWLSVWSYYVITLIPVLGIIQVGGQSMADRYTYLPGLGPSLMMGLAAAWMWEHTKNVARRSPPVKLMANIVVILVCILLSYLTVRQIRIWNNGIVLWNYVIEKEPGAIRAYYNRGLTFGIMDRPDKAIEDYDKAISLDPDFHDAYMNRGAMYAVMGRFDKAIEDYNQVIALNSSNYEAYSARGAAFEQIDQVERAIKDYSQAIALNPTYYEAYIKRGILLGKTGLFDLAIDDFNHSIQIKSDNAEAFVGRGTAFALLGQNSRAMEDFNRAIELNQNLSITYFNRGRLYAKTGNRERAVSDLRKACELGSIDGCNALR